MLKTLRLCIDLGHRHVEKIARGFENARRFFHRFSSTIDEKSSPKVRNTLSARKIDKKSLPGTPCGAKDRFLVDLGDPQGTQKSSQRGAHHWGKGSWELPEVLDTNLGVVSETFWGGIRDFLVNSGSILGHPGSNFINFGILFVVCVCVCLLFGEVLYFFGLLGCCVVGFLGSWILELLGCLVSGLLDCWVVWLSVCCWVVGLLGCWVGGLLDC